MYFDPTDTLAYHRSRILCRQRDMSMVSCDLVAHAITTYMEADQNADTKPETEALYFYALNHGMALISAERDTFEPLTEFERIVADLYHKTSAASAVRAFYYLLLICTRESRHVSHHSSPNLSAEVTEQFGAACAFFNHKIANSSSDTSYKMFLNYPPATATIGKFVSSLRHIFYKGKFSSSFGGPAWGKIADCLENFVYGRYSAEMMLDTVATLAHNTGPIYNKGMLYGHHTNALQRLLDVQRAGLIPEAILYDEDLRKFAPDDLRVLVLGLKERFPGKIGHYVDWFTVEALGSVNKYPSDQAKQVAAHGMPKSASDMEKAKHAAIKKAKAQAEAKKAAHAKNFLQIMPGVEVPKIHRSKAA